MINQPQQGSLFSDQELDNLDGNLFAEQNTSESITCLGKVFESEEARREYFREELRKKLPELRHIEGFPIGEDEDIIALSDPPYYTACPNPWINDFIAQWEAEKADLEAKGLRKSDFEVMEPYAADVSEGKTNPVYVAHTYHTKVPHPAIMRYILNYTQPGDIIFDGFAGTGMTGVAAQACGDSYGPIADKIESQMINLFGKKPNWGIRHAICCDLSPYASMITYNYNTPTDTQFLINEAKRIIKEVNEECAWMYTTKENGQECQINYVVWSDVCICSNCGGEYIYWNIAIDKFNKKLKDSFECPHCNSLQRKREMQKKFETKFDSKLNETTDLAASVPVIVVLTTSSGKRIERAPNKDDIELLKKIDNIDCNLFYPCSALSHGFNLDQPQRSHHINHFHQFYTKRNLIALATLYNKILKSPYSNKLRFIFTGMINRSTKMNRVHVNNYFYGGGGWNAGHLKGTLYIPNAPVETSILEQIEDKLNGFVRAIPYLPSQYDNCNFVASAENSLLKENSIDYIFVDPPFGANIMYSELNTLPEAWLKVVTNNKHEAIENPGQDKTTKHYLSTMQSCFKEFYRILKPGKWMTVEFSNTSASVWNTIQQAITSVGFVIVYVAALDKGQGGIRSITTTTAVRQDLVISCYKPTTTLTQKFQNSDDKAANIWDFVSELLEHLPVHIVKDKKTTTIVERSPKILFDRVIAYYVQHNYPVPMNAQDFQKGLRERFIELDGMFFTAQQALEYKDKKRKAPEIIPMGLIVSDEANGIEWLKIELKTPQTYQEIQPKWMQAVDAIRKNDKIPELKQILDENFIKEENGKWRLPNIQDDKDVAELRHKALMREFKLYVEAASKPKGKIKEARVEALRAGFKQCYIDKDFQTIVRVGDRIPANLRDEDEVLLQFYDIALNKI